MTVIVRLLEEAVAKGEHYRIDEVEVQVAGYGFDWTRMWRPLLHVGGGVMVSPCREHAYTKKPDRLEERLKDHRPEKGYWKLYGNSEGPLGEFEEIEVNGVKYPVELRIITSLSNKCHDDDMPENVYSFSGNHERFSGAFNYIIWNEDLKNQVALRLMELGFPKNESFKGCLQYPPKPVAFTVKMKDISDPAKNPGLQMSVDSILRNPKIPKKPL